MLGVHMCVGAGRGCASPTVCEQANIKYKPLSVLGTFVPEQFSSASVRSLTHHIYLVGPGMYSADLHRVNTERAQEVKFLGFLASAWPRISHFWREFPCIEHVMDTHKVFSQASRLWSSLPSENRFSSPTFLALIPVIRGYTVPGHLVLLMGVYQRFRNSFLVACAACISSDMSFSWV